MKTPHNLKISMTDPFVDQDFSQVECEEFGMEGVDANGNIIGFELEATETCGICTLQMACIFFREKNYGDKRDIIVKEELGVDYFYSENQLQVGDTFEKYLTKLHNMYTGELSLLDLYDFIEDTYMSYFKTSDHLYPELIMRRLLKDNGIEVTEEFGELTRDALKPYALQYTNKSKD